MPRAGGFIDRTRQKSLFFHTSARASAAHQPNLLASRRCGMNKIYEAPGFDFVKNWSINTRKPYFLLTIIRTRHPNCFFFDHFLAIWFCHNKNKLQPYRLGPRVARMPLQQ
jgi:hypothetical protein